MKFTLSWLKTHLETDADLDTLTGALTALGLEVEEVTDRGRGLAAFRIAKVIGCEQHPDADRLRVCMVDTGTGDPVQVVCGAPNARLGLLGVFAPSGTVVPGLGITLKASSIRGVESNGMLLSERELGLSDEHQGIVDLPPDAPVGTPYPDYAGLNDPLIEIGLTPDRADCAGIRGIARDLAAAGLGKLKPLAAEPVTGHGPCPVGLSIGADVSAAAPVFALRLIRGVRNSHSPQWLRDRLVSVGLRPISALVDITNFFTMDQARPLHVFDAGKVRGSLALRASRAGETLEALNDRSYTLGDGMTVIADDSGVISLGGIVGGTSTSVDEATVDVLLECAFFDPATTARTGQALQIDSDARYRFERGVDPASVLPGIGQATRMIIDVCGGEATDITVAGAVPDITRTLSLRPDRVRTLGGLDVSLEAQAAALKGLGFEVSGPGPDGALSVVTPSWRRDVEGEADLVEEVLRIIGYDAIPVVALPRTDVVTRPALSDAQRKIARLRRLLATRCLHEAITWSFMAEAEARLFGFGDEGLRLVNPISSDLDVMRPSIVPNLVKAAARNIAHGQADPSLFEVGPVFRDPTATGQVETATMVRAGRTGPRNWAQSPRAFDAFDAKADAIAVLEALDAPVDNLQVSTDAPSWYHPGRSGCLRLGPTVLAYFGELHPTVAGALDISGPVVAAEVFTGAVPAPKRKREGAAKPPVVMSQFQPVERDLAFVVDADTPADKIIRAARSADKALITSVAIFDVYQGEHLEAGKKSVAISIRLQPVSSTLTEKEIDAVSEKVIASVKKQTGGTLRA